MFEMWDVWQECLRYSGLGMSGMWDVWDIGYSGGGMFSMLNVWDVNLLDARYSLWDVRCFGCGM